MKSTPIRRPLVVPLIGVALAAAYILGRTLPGLGHDVHLAMRQYGGITLYLAGAALCLARAPSLRRGDRIAWTLLGAGLVAYALGSAAAFSSDGPAPDPPAIAYVGWLLFYAAAYPALLMLLRARLRPFTLSFCLDGVLGGLTVAAVCAAVVDHDLHGMAPLKAIAGLAFPCADLVLLSLLVWACAMTRWRGGMWIVLAAAMATTAVGDILLDLSVARGDFDQLDVSTALFPIAMVLIGVAAWRPAPPVRNLRTDAGAVLAMPGVCIAAVAGVLVFGDADDAITAGLAFSALAVAFVRSGLTYRELATLHEERRFAQGFEEANIGMALVSADLRWLRVNATVCQLVGRSAEELVGRPVSEVVLPGEPRLEDELPPGATPEPYVRRILRPDGTVVDLAISATRIVGDDGLPSFFSQLQDVTERLRVERHSRALADLSRVALELHEADELVDVVTTMIAEAMPAATCRIAGVPGGESAPEPESDWLVGAPLHRRTGPPATLVVRRDRDRPPFTDIHVRFLEAAANVLGTALDRATIEEELRTQALEDPLTGLANRSYLAAHVEQAIAKADRGEELALLLLDLDRFKVVNDTLGHGAGDELLCSVADRLRATLRRGDLAVRLGGDEFVVVFAGSGDAAWEAAALAQRLLEALAEPYVVDGRELHVSASAGLVFVDSPDVTAESLLRDADVAMYRAKEHGGARYEVFDAGLRARVVHRLAIESELRHAVERDELTLHLQPVVDLHRDELAGFEALVRWNHPQRGMVAPAEFIGIAEETGLIVPIGAWVLDEAARHLAALQAAAGRPLRMSINLSARQLTPGLVDDVRAAAAAAGVEPRQLTLEVTETLLVEGRSAVEVLEELRASGIAIAIDDFGTGWSSLGALQRYPVDVLKLDRSLVSPAADSAPAAALARAVVEMAQALGLDVIAEGIETDAQLATMQALGCPHGQGYVFARPMPLDAALELVSRPRPTARAARAPTA